MDKRKYKLFVKLLEVMHESAEEGVKAMRSAVEENYANLFAHNAQVRYEGREGALFDVLELLRDEEFFYQMIGNYSIKG